jgi:SAM-dependent methyltransferase
MIHNQKLKQIRRKRSDSVQPESKLFFEEYSHEIFERISLVKNKFKNGMAFGFRNIKIPRSKNIQNLFHADIYKSETANIISDEEFLPIKGNSLDLIVSFFNIHFVNDIPGTLFQINQSLRANGLFIACLFAGDTLKELRYCLMIAEEEILGGTSPKISPFADLNDLSSLLQRANFTLPVADIDRHKIIYKNPEKLFSDIREMGETNILNERQKNFSRKDVIKRAIEIYKKRFSSKDGKIYSTFEIAWLLGWKYDENQPKPLTPGSAEKNLEEAINELS